MNILMPDRLWDQVLGRGTVIDHRRDQHEFPEFDDPCPFCDSRVCAAFRDEEWSGRTSSPDDVWLCLGCGATRTRRDASGFDAWEKDRVVDAIDALRAHASDEDVKPEHRRAIEHEVRAVAGAFRGKVRS